jgi:predicted DNA-binding transcriptional regulator YafY
MTNPFANTVKLLSAVTLLSSPQGTTIKGLMKRLGISRRSVFRLIEAMEELGFPLIDEQPQPRVEKTYRLMDSYVLKLPNLAIPNPGFSPEELDAVLSVLDFCNRLIKLGPALKSIGEKITAITAKSDKEQAL